MSAFDPTLIMLVNLYVDEFNTRQDTKVYNNGVMQVSLFVSVNYNGDTDDEIEKQTKEYVQDNVVIYTLEGGKAELDTSKWKKSTEDNGYYHDIDHAGKQAGNGIPEIRSDIRAPLYITVPPDSEGEHRWIAKLNGEETSSDKPVTVTVKMFAVTLDDVELVDRVKTKNCYQMRVLKYKDGVFPEVQHMLKLVEYQGIKFVEGADKAWISMIHSGQGHKMGVFLEYKETENIRIAKIKRMYTSDEMVKNGPGVYMGQQAKLYCSCCDESLSLSRDALVAGWNEGIVMFMVHSSSIRYERYYDHVFDSYLNMETKDFITTDNFGGRTKVTIDWNSYHPSWYGDWKIWHISVDYP